MANAVLWSFPCLCSEVDIAVRYCKCFARQVQQQGTAALQAAVSEMLQLLSHILSILQLCPREYLCSMPTAQRRQHKALLEFFITAGPQLLLSTIGAAHTNQGLVASGYLQSLALGLQSGIKELLQPSLTALLKRNELGAAKEGAGRLLDALELAAREERLHGKCEGRGSQHGMYESADSCSAVYISPMIGVWVGVLWGSVGI